MIAVLGAGESGVGAAILAKQKGFDVFGVESNIKARKICLERNIGVQSTESELAPASFDTISLWHVLEHLPHPESSLATYRALLRPSGLLVVAVPNFESHDRIHYQQDWAALDVPRHLWHFSPKGLVSYLEQNGFLLIKQKPMYMDSFYVCMLSEKYKGAKLWFLKGFCVGLFSTFVSFFTKSFSSTMFVFKNQI